MRSSKNKFLQPSFSRKMKNSKGQVTVFMIIGLMLLLFGMIFYFMLSIQEKKQIIFVPTTEEQFFMQDCTKIRAEKLIYRASLTGGYLSIQEKGYIMDLLSIPYYLEGNVREVPDLEVLQKDLKGGFDAAYDECLDELTKTKLSAAEKKDDKGAAVSIYDEEIVVEYPGFLVRKADAVKEVGKIIGQYKIPFGKFHRISKDIVNNYAINKGKVDMSFLEQKGEKIAFFLEEGKTTVFSIYRNTDQGVYEFVFAVKP